MAFDDSTPSFLWSITIALSTHQRNRKTSKSLFLQSFSVFFWRILTVLTSLSPNSSTVTTYTLPHTSKLATLTNTFSLAWLPSILRDAVASWGSPVIVAVRISGLPQRRSLRRQKTRRNPGFTGNIGMSLVVKPASIFSYHDGLGKWSNLTIFCFKWVESTKCQLYYILDYIGCQF